MLRSVIRVKSARYFQLCDPRARLKKMSPLGASTNVMGLQ